jgi:hypothetical protein
VAVSGSDIGWNRESTVTRTNLAAFDIAVGDTLSVSVVVDHDTPSGSNGFQNGSHGGRQQRLP